MAEYEFWLTDDSGIRIKLLKEFSFCTYSRSINGYGTMHLGMPLDLFDVRPLFLPDRRIDVWRSPAQGYPLRRESSYFLRKWNVYTRDDNVDIIEFYGRSPIDILRRQAVVSYTVANYSKTDFADDMMKEIVSENFISPAQTAPSGELISDGNVSLGPSISASFFGENVLDILQNIKNTTISLSKSTSSKKIYFDVVEGAPLAGGGFGYIFRTYADLRGTDRTSWVTFSKENGNIASPSYFENHLDSFTVVDILNSSDSSVNGSADSSDRYLSRWNDVRLVNGTSETDAAVNDAKANQVLQSNSAEKSLNVKFLNTPGSNNQPRSLYGIDWDLGDLLPVRYADKNFSVEVAIVYASINDNGEENITGLSQVQ